MRLLLIAECIMQDFDISSEIQILSFVDKFGAEQLLALAYSCVPID